MPLTDRSIKTKSEIARILMADVKKDLHLHTYYSDGALSPKEVVNRWADEGYELIAITDHDGIAGSIAGREYAEKRGIGYISGIEFDSSDVLGRDIHILGYGFDYRSHKLQEALEGILLERAARNDSLLTALNEMGYPIDFDDIMAVNEGRYVGKPTFAKILAKKGYTESSQAVFNSIFREPQIRKIHKRTLSSKEVIDLIHEAGGLAVFAHPMEQRHLGETYDQFRGRLLELLDKMREYGVDGIECYHPSADDVQAEELAGYAGRYGLLITKGSDFHSDIQKRNFTRYHRP